MSRRFQIVDSRRARKALSFGALLLAFLMIVGFTSKQVAAIVDPMLDVGAAPFFWYLGGMQETGPIGLIAFLLDILVYGLGFYILLSLKQYLAWRRTRSRP